MMESSSPEDMENLGCKREGGRDTTGEETGGE